MPPSDRLSVSGGQRQNCRGPKLERKYRRKVLHVTLMEKRMGVLLYREEFFSEAAAMLDHHSCHFPLAKQAFTANTRSLDPERPKQRRMNSWFCQILCGGN